MLDRLTLWLVQLCHEVGHFFGPVRGTFGSREFSGFAGSCCRVEGTSQGIGGPLTRGVDSTRAVAGVGAVVLLACGEGGSDDICGPQAGLRTGRLRQIDGRIWVAALGTVVVGQARKLRLRVIEAHPLILGWQAHIEF